MTQRKSDSYQQISKCPLYDVYVVDAMPGAVSILHNTERLHSAAGCCDTLPIPTTWPVCVCAVTRLQAKKHPSHFNHWGVAWGSLDRMAFRRQLYLPWKWSLSGPSALRWMCRETKADPFYYRSSIEDKTRHYNPKGGVYSHFRSCYMIMLLQDKTGMWVWWHAVEHIFIQWMVTSYR